MKSEHRHDLKSNELEKLVRKIRPFFETYWFRILMAACGVAVAAGVTLFFVRSFRESRSAGWTQMSISTTAEQFLQIAETEELQDKPVVDWARLSAAESYLQTGIRLSLEHREGEQGLVSDLDDAKENFDQVLKSASGRIRERALFGLARCLEAMAGVNLSSTADDGPQTTGQSLAEAVKAYQKLIKEFPNTPYNRKSFEQDELGRIERRIEHLEYDAAQEFYAWFRTQNPKREDRPNPFDISPGASPTDNLPVTLPPIPERLRLPVLPEENTPERKNEAAPFPNAVDSPQQPSDQQKKAAPFPLKSDQKSQSPKKSNDGTEDDKKSSASEAAGGNTGPTLKPRQDDKPGQIGTKARPK